MICLSFAAVIHSAQNDSNREVTVDSHSVVYDDALIDVKLEVPVISGLEDLNMERWLNSLFAASAASFVGPVAQAAQAFALDIGYGQINSVPFLPYVVHVSYDVKRNDGRIVSVVLEMYQFTGGAHGLSHWEAFNFDTKTGKVLKLDDIFRSGTEWRDLIRSEINSQMAEDTETYYFPPGQLATDWIPNPKKFYLTDTELVIFFDLYEIAPYAYGHPTFSISLETIQDMLNPEVSLAAAK